MRISFNSQSVVDFLRVGVDVDEVSICVVDFKVLEVFDLLLLLFALTSFDISLKSAVLSLKTLM